MSSYYQLDKGTSSSVASENCVVMLNLTKCKTSSAEGARVPRGVWGGGGGAENFEN